MSNQERKNTEAVLKGAIEGASILTSLGHVCLAPAHAMAVAAFVTTLTTSQEASQGAWSVDRFDEVNEEPVALSHKGKVMATAPAKQADKLEAAAAALNACDVMRALLTEAAAPGGLSAERFQRWRLEALHAVGESAAQVVKAA